MKISDRDVKSNYCSERFADYMDYFNNSLVMSEVYLHTYSLFINIAKLKLATIHPLGKASAVKSCVY